MRNTPEDPVSDRIRPQNRVFVARAAIRSQRRRRRALFRRPVRAGFYASRGPRRSLAALCAVGSGAISEALLAPL
jgi:hypothetical protein